MKNKNNQLISENNIFALKEGSISEILTPEEVGKMLAKRNIASLRKKGITI